MTQKLRLLRYFVKHDSITPLESWRILGIYRLSDVVFQLRKHGHPIETELIKVTNQFDEEIGPIARYHYHRNKKGELF